MEEEIVEDLVVAVVEEEEITFMIMAVVAIAVAGGELIIIMVEVEIERKAIEMEIHTGVEEEEEMDILLEVITIHHLGGFMIGVVEEDFIEGGEEGETPAIEDVEDLHHRGMEIVVTIVQMVEVEAIIIMIINRRVIGGGYNQTMEVVWGIITAAIQINTPIVYHRNHLRPVVTTTMMI